MGSIQEAEAWSFGVKTGGRRGHNLMIDLEGLS